MDELLGAAPPAEGSNEPAESSCQSKHALLTPTCAGLSPRQHRELREPPLDGDERNKNRPGENVEGKKKKNLPGYGERCNAPNLFMAGLKQIGAE